MTNRILHTAIIGAGQAGLAAGYYLRHLARDFIILDAHARVGDTWRQRWDGLRLFSPQRYNELPGMPPAGKPGYLPDHLEVADYLENYARHWRIPVRCGATVTECLPPQGENAFWTVRSNTEAVFARNLIVASGAYRTPAVPRAVAESFPAGFRQVHSSEIRDVNELADDRTDVLILGAGASGQQLSRLFHATGATVLLAGSKVPNLPRHLLGKDIYFWLYASGLMTARTDRFPGKLFASNGKGTVTVGEGPLPDGGRFRRVRARLSKYESGTLIFAGKKKKPAPLPWPEGGRRPLVVWCTGFSNTYPFLPDAALDDNGSPHHIGGKHPRLPGLYFLGLPELTRPNSSLLGGVGKDAEQVVKSLG